MNLRRFDRIGQPLCALVAALCCVPLLGCQRAVEPAFVSAAEMEQLAPELQELVHAEMRRWTGTAGDPKLLGAESPDASLLKRGAEVYRQNCQQCHGASGDGDGPAARYLTPRPRDYRRGIFKFTSTPYGTKPRREDLRRTIEQGVIGTSMPSFRLLPQRDLDAVLEYVLALTRRGELEQLLIAHVDSEGELDEEMSAEYAQIVVDQWRDSADEVVEPLSKMPPITAESIAAGAEIFQKRECYKCHGRDGRGGLAGGIEVGNDAWGFKDPAADLTSGLLHGGPGPLDVYRRIAAGINGTPMPAFRDSFADDPDAIWHLAHYVLSLSNQRRRGLAMNQPSAALASEESPHEPTTDDAKDTP